MLNSTKGKISHQRYKKYRYIKKRMSEYLKGHDSKFSDADRNESKVNINDGLSIPNENPQNYLLLANMTENSINVQVSVLLNNREEISAHAPLNSRKMLTKFLREWSLENNITHKQLTSLLKGLKIIFKDVNIPSDARTLLNTKRTSNIKFICSNPDTDTGGHFTYIILYIIYYIML